MRTISRSNQEPQVDAEVRGRSTAVETKAHRQPKPTDEAHIHKQTLKFQNLEPHTGHIPTAPPALPNNKHTTTQY